MSIISFKISSGELYYQNTLFNALPFSPYNSSTSASLQYLFVPQNFKYLII